MSGVNRVILLGRLGKSPEARTLENGTMVVNFSMATSEVFKDKVTGERKETTDWHNIVLWRGLAETASKYLHKGDQVYIEGKMRTRSWEKDGITRYTTEVIGDNMTLLGKSESSSGNQNSAPRNTWEESRKSAATTPVMDTSTDDLPF